MFTVTELLRSLREQDATRPRLTWYGVPGERVELSGKVLDNWVSKAANLLQDEFDLTPGGLVGIRLPGTHWRSFYWALAVWAVGGTLVDCSATAGAVATRPGEPVAAPVDVLVTDRAGETDSHGTDSPGTDSHGTEGGPEAWGDSSPVEHGLIVVTPDSLARRHPGPIPAGAVDEARQLSSYGDQFVAWADPDPTDQAVLGESVTVCYADLILVPESPAGRPARVFLPTYTPMLDALITAVRTWADAGSVVIAPTDSEQALARVLQQEGIQDSARAAGITWRPQR